MTNKKYVLILEKKNLDCDTKGSPLEGIISFLTAYPKVFNTPDEAGEMAQYLDNHRFSFGIPAGYRIRCRLWARGKDWDLDDLMDLSLEEGTFFGRLIK